VLVYIPPPTVGNVLTTAVKFVSSPRHGVDVEAVIYARGVKDDNALTWQQTVPDFQLWRPCSGPWLQVICPKGHFFVRNVVVQIPKFDAKPNPNPSPNPNSNPNSNPNPMPIRFGQMTLQTSELLSWSLPGAYARAGGTEVLTPPQLLHDN